MIGEPMVSAGAKCGGPRLVYSAGFDLAALGAPDREKLAEHCRSLGALRTAVGRGALGELCNLPAYSVHVDFDADCVIAARDPAGGIIATAQIHRASRFFSWAELWYTAWPGPTAHRACLQAIGRAVQWARRRRYACLVAYAAKEGCPERAMLERAGFHIAFHDKELIAELDLDL